MNLNTIEIKLEDRDMIYWKMECEYQSEGGILDLQESIGTVESAKRAYDTIFELKIANAQVRASTSRPGQH